MAQSRFSLRRNQYSRSDADTNRLEEENMLMREQLNRCQLQIQASNEQLALLRQRYQMLVNELSMKEKAAEEISRLALKEANHIVETAQGNADIIIREALVSAKMVFREIDKLTSQTKDMRSDIKTKLDSMGQMLDSFKIPEVDNIDYLSRTATGKRSNKI